MVLLFHALKADAAIEVAKQLVDSPANLGRSQHGNVAGTGRLALWADFPR